MESPPDIRRRVLELVPKLRKTGLYEFQNLYTNNMGMLDPWLRGQSTTEETIVEFSLSAVVESSPWLSQPQTFSSAPPSVLPVECKELRCQVYFL